MPVATRADRERFVRLPWRIYANDPAWVPPLLLERRGFVDPAKHPFYEFGAAKMFLAVRDGADVGRVLVADDPRDIGGCGPNSGVFGMFETLDDQAIADALLNTAREWLRSRGRVRMFGPIDYSMNYSCGLLVDGFDTPPRLMMNHNPPYYAGLLSRAGAEKAKDLIAWWIDLKRDLGEWRTRVERLTARGRVTLRSFRQDRLPQEIAHCKEIYHRSWRENWGFTPMTDAEYVDMARQVAAWARPELMLMAEVDGAPIGFSMTMPDLNEAMRPLNGKLFNYGLPIGYLRFAWRAKRVDAARMLVLGVLPEFRRRGVAEALILRSFDVGNQLGYRGAELSWTLEDNVLINRSIQAVGGKSYKTYRIFRIEF
ncbi:MAG: GNAT family N-acetyltransferase [Pirellulales bacterium]